MHGGRGKCVISRPFHGWRDAGFTGEFRPFAMVSARPQRSGPQRTVTAMTELLTLIATWLSIHFGLPATDAHPRVELVPSARMAVLRYRGLAGDRAPVATPATDAPLDAGRNIVALYDDTRRVIYLPQDWRGTPAEVSVLVHEMVHHLQNEAGMKFACPAEREKEAYYAQAKYLALHGLTLEQEFAIDALSLLVRTNCLD
jgi:hypothetical protein